MRLNCISFTITLIIVSVIVFSLSSSLLIQNISVVSAQSMTNSTSEGHNSNGLDRFGIKELYASKMKGTEWFSNWDNGKKRTLFSEETDPYDNEFKLRGDGKVVIDGNGLALLSGSAPRMFVYDKSKLNKYDNVEITFYGKRVAETDNLSWNGLISGGRSKHLDNYVCNGQTYYGRMTYDGRITFEKELFHGHGIDAFYSLNSDATRQPWNGTSGTMPKNVWIGFKFVIRTVDNGTHADLELYRDMTDGKNGGTWDKVLEYKDDGAWSVTAEKGLCNNIPNNLILLEPGFVFIRNDEVQQAQYKKFSIREIT
jgi:hypothetical protein